jgi:hypothetical protein
MSGEKYWMAWSGETFGPYELADIQRRWNAGELAGDEQLCRVGDASETWVGARQLFEPKTAKVENNPKSSHGSNSNGHRHVAQPPSLLKRYLSEDQDEGAVRKILGKAESLLTSGETIDFIGVQKKLLINLSPDAVVLTNRRFMIVRPKLLGMTFEDYLWPHVADVHLSEQMLTATIYCVITNGHKLEIDSLPKAQARRIYAYAQGVEEQMHKLRHARDLETRRASAGGVVINGTLPGATMPAAAVVGGDPVQMLSKLKQMLDAGLIEQGEYDAKKAEVLSRM